MHICKNDDRHAHTFLKSSSNICEHNVYELSQNCGEYSRTIYANNYTSTQTIFVTIILPGLEHGAPTRKKWVNTMFLKKTKKKYAHKFFADF